MLICIEYQNRLHVKANIILRKAIMLFEKKIRFTGGVDELRFKKERKEHYVLHENAITSKTGEAKANGAFKAERAGLAALIFSFFNHEK